MDCERPTPGWLFVLPDHIGQGIGRALWTAVRKEAVARGIASFPIEADPKKTAVPNHRVVFAHFPRRKCKNPRLLRRGFLA
ncbi:GNAT family N-acetyltransferase [Burkholderia multivorans]|uniref:GNAT family N-acetyltransferase n=1 Tax=Burkholderia multivorans TaxID=87883 RepID=UPI002ED9A6D0